jgi:hypothetical protein
MAKASSVRELVDRIDNPTPDCHTGSIASGRELVGPSQGLSALSSISRSARYSTAADRGLQARPSDTFCDF